MFSKNNNEKKILNCVIKCINHVVLIVSIMMLVLGTLSNILHRVPIISYFASEMRVPYTLTMQGKVFAFDNDGQIVLMINPSVNIGGFYTEVESNGEYSIRFVSGTNSGKVPVRISFSDVTGKECIFYEDVFYNGEYELVADFNLKMENDLN